MGTPPIQMANLGMADSLILMVMALVVFGPRRLPQIGRQIGKLMYEFRKASNDFKFQMEEELRTSEEAERRQKEEDRLRALALAAPPPPALTVETPTNAAAENSNSNENLDAPAIEAPAEAPPDEAYPSIKPPSTGEQVAAARPNGLTALVEAAKDSRGVDASEAMVSEGAPMEPGASEPEPSASEPEQAPAQPEQAAHHG